MRVEDLRPIGSREEALQIKLPPIPASICASSPTLEDTARYPLRGIPVDYKDPTEPVAESEWETLK